jgi:hypothetical protein
MGFMVGGGANNFTDSGMQHITDIGGNWTARFLLGTRSYVAGEFAYLGTANGLNQAGLDRNAILLGNGIEGDLRINFALQEWQPYIFAGTAWKHYAITNSTFNTSSILNSDDLLEVPVGAGLSWRYRGFVADVRGDYRPTFGADLLSRVPGLAVTGTNLNTWSAQGRIGFEF